MKNSDDRNRRPLKAFSVLICTAMLLTAGMSFTTWAADQNDGAKSGETVSQTKTGQNETDPAESAEKTTAKTVEALKKNPPIRRQHTSDDMPHSSLIVNLKFVTGDQTLKEELYYSIDFPAQVTTYDLTGLQEYIEGYVPASTDVIFLETSDGPKAVDHIIRRYNENDQLIYMAQKDGADVAQVQKFANFTLSYEPKPADDPDAISPIVQFHAQKLIGGQPADEAHPFDIVLKKATSSYTPYGSVHKVTTDENGNAYFNNVVIDAKDTYFLMSETTSEYSSLSDSVSMDTHVYKIHIHDGDRTSEEDALTVEVDGKQLGTIDPEDYLFTFNNSPKAVTVELPTRCRVVYRKYPDIGKPTGGEAVLKIAAGPGPDGETAPLPGGSVTATLKDKDLHLNVDENAYFVHGFFPSTKVDLPKEGVYTYRITEESCSSGYKKDNTVYELTFTVTKDEKGVLAAEGQLKDLSTGEGSQYFDNLIHFTNEKSGKYQLIKKWENPYHENSFTIPDEDEFLDWITVKRSTPGQQAQPVPDSELTDPVISRKTLTSNEETWTLTWSGLPDTDRDGHPYTYTFEENEEEAVRGGFWPQYSGESSITNEYIRQDSLNPTLPSVTKSLTHTGIHPPEAPPYPGRPRAPEKTMFKFKVETKIDPEISGVTLDSPIRDDDGSHTFSISVAKEGTESYDFQPVDLSGLPAGTTVTYIISEIPGDDEAIRYSPEKYFISYRIYEIDGEKKVSRTVHYSDNELSDPMVHSDSTLKFYNIYSQGITVDLSLEIRKLLKSSAADSPNLTFRFRIEPVNGAPAPKDEDGNVISEFSPITVSTASPKGTGTLSGAIRLPKPGKYKYRIYEIDDGQNGVTYSPRVHTIEFYADDLNYDSPSMKLTQVRIDNENFDSKSFYLPGSENPVLRTQFTFKNSYTSPNSLKIRGKKILKNGTLKKGDFSFKLEAGEGTTLPDHYQNIVKNNADGSFSFPEIPLDRSDVGKEYTYTVSEVLGSDSRITYDSARYEIRISDIRIENGIVTFRKTITKYTGDSTVGSSADAVTFINKVHGGKTPGKISPVTADRSTPGAYAGLAAISAALLTVLLWKKLRTR